MVRVMRTAVSAVIAGSLFLRLAFWRPLGDGAARRREDT
jgi:hypothetical protein